MVTHHSLVSLQWGKELANLDNQQIISKYYIDRNNGICRSPIANKELSKT
jgi:hypothetical protein